MISLVHTGSAIFGAGMLKAPELVISKEEATQLVLAWSEFADAWGLEATVDPRLGATLQLVAVVAMTIAPKVATVKKRVNVQRIEQKRQRDEAQQAANAAAAAAIAAGATGNVG